jgi:hypothetical protein
MNETMKYVGTDHFHIIDGKNKAKKSNLFITRRFRTLDLSLGPSEQKPRFLLPPPQVSVAALHVFRIKARDLMEVSYNPKNKTSLPQAPDCCFGPETAFPSHPRASKTLRWKEYQQLRERYKLSLLQHHIKPSEQSPAPLPCGR